MNQRRLLVLPLACASALIAACAGAPLAPTAPPGASAPASGPSVAIVPSVSGVTIQGRRPRQPPNFADLGELIDVSARLTASTGAVTYEWTAPLGRIEGNGASVTWRAPSTARTP